MAIVDSRSGTHKVILVKEGTESVHTFHDSMESATSCADDANRRSAEMKLHGEYKAVAV